MNTIIEKIRAEIIKRIDKRRLSEQAKNELVSLLSFLSDLEKECEEKPTTAEQPVCEELGKEMDRFFTSEEYEEAKKAGFGEAHTARHFAKWGAEHAKEELMKEAVEGCVTMYANKTYPTLIGIRERIGDTGDKVKLIIVKEDRL